MNRDSLKNNLNEQENLSADEQKISRLIGGMEKVSAPKDFDFRVKARISAAKENNFQPSVWRTLRYALPLTATLVIAAFVMIQGGLFSQTDKQSPVVENQNPLQPVKSESLPSNIEMAETSNSAVEVNKKEDQIPDSFVSESNQANTITAKIPSKKTDKNLPLVLPKVEQPNSRDITVRESNVNILPEGIPGNTASLNKDFSQNNSVTAREILNFIGVETENEGNKMRVKSVKENSLAGRSGVQTGDIVEAIDEQRLDQKNLSPKFKGGKTITVTRDNKVLEIELKPN